MKKMGNPTWFERSANAYLLQRPVLEDVDQLVPHARPYGHIPTITLA